MDESELKDSINELNLFLIESKKNLKGGGTLEILKIIKNILQYNSSWGINAQWVFDEIEKIEHKDIESRIKNIAIYWLVSKLEEHGCSQTQSSLFLGEWLSLSPRRVLQIFQLNRKLFINKNESMYGENVTFEHQCNMDALVFIYSNICVDNIFPKNPHAVRAIKKYFKEIKGLTKNDTVIQPNLEIALLHIESRKFIAA